MPENVYIDCLPCLATGPLHISGHIQQRVRYSGCTSSSPRSGPTATSNTSSSNGSIRCTTTATTTTTTSSSSSNGSILSSTTPIQYA